MGWDSVGGNQAGLRADRMETNGRGAKAGIKVGDQLTAINQHEVKNTASQVGQLYRAGVWSKATYSLIRESVPVDAVVIWFRWKIGQPMEADYRADLSLHWAVCFAAPLDGAGLDALLYFLPGLVYFLFVQLHRETERV